jgi:acetyl esterase/lipase
MINLWENEIIGFDEKIGQNRPNMTPYLIESGESLPAIIICPGGGYTHKSEKEGKPIAQWLNSIGINVFVLDYRVAPYKHPYPMLDVQRAIRYVRYNFKKFNIDANRIGILGFSAGGHLAATASTYFDFGKEEAIDDIDKVSSRPDIAVLCYPVVTFGEYAHKGSIANLLGENATNELIESLSLEKQVKENTPPTFLWHTAEDKSVPMQNSLLYAEALKKKGVDFELHIFPRGRHGIALTNEIPYVQRWAKLCEEWFIEKKFIIKENF